MTTSDDVHYDFLGEAQDRITKLIAIYVPDAMWTVPTAMSTTDNKTFTFGADVDSANIFALGHFRVYAQRSDIPDSPLIPGEEYTVEGTLIRIPHNATRTFSDGTTPWVTYVAPSNVIAAATQPTIPKIARAAMISDAARRGALRLRDSALASDQEEQFQSDWMELLAAIRTQADRKYSAGSSRIVRWTTGELGWGKSS